MLAGTTTTSLASLLRASIETLGAQVERIEIVDLQENTFFARILLRRETESFELDSRLSDAIALSLRTEAPIFVARQVLERADAFAVAETELSEEEKIRRQREERVSNDLGKYTM